MYASTDLGSIHRPDTYLSTVLLWWAVPAYVFLVGGAFMPMLLCLLLLCVPMSLDHEQGEPTDFTDTGVGCIDDCLEPAERVE